MRVTAGKHRLRFAQPREIFLGVRELIHRRLNPSCLVLAWRKSHQNQTWRHNLHAVNLAVVEAVDIYTAEPVAHADLRVWRALRSRYGTPPHAAAAVMRVTSAQTGMCGRSRTGTGRGA